MVYLIAALQVNNDRTSSRWILGSVSLLREHVLRDTALYNYTTQFH